MEVMDTKVMDDSEINRRGRKPNYSRDEVLTIICGVQENKYNLLKKSCTVNSNKTKQAGWKAICDRLNFFNPDRQRTIEEVRKKWKDLSAQARSDLMCKRDQAQSDNSNGADGTGDARNLKHKEVPVGEFTPLILSILGEVGSISVSSEDTGLLNINLSTLSGLTESQPEQETVNQFYEEGVVIQKNEQQSSDTSQQEQDSEVLDEKKRNRKPNYTKKDVLNLLQGMAEHKYDLFSKLCNHTSNKVKAEAWQAICDVINAQNQEVVRTQEELRKKWKDLSKLARQDLVNLRAAVAAGNSKSPTPQCEFTSMCLPLLVEIGACDATQEEINALKVNSITTVISLHQAVGSDFVAASHSQPTVIPAVIEKDCETFVGDSATFNATSLIGTAQTIGETANVSDTQETSGEAEFALSTLASVSASKLKEKIREKLASGNNTTADDIEVFNGVEVRLIGNHHHQAQQEQSQQQQDPQTQHITLDEATSIMTTAANSTSSLINSAYNNNNNNHQQQHELQHHQIHVQNGLPPGVTIHTTGSAAGGSAIGVPTIQLATPIPQHLFRGNILTGSSANIGNNSIIISGGNNNNNNNNAHGITISNVTGAGNIHASSPLKRKHTDSLSNNAATTTSLNNSISASSSNTSITIPGSINTSQGTTVYPLPVSIHPATVAHPPPPLSVAPMTVFANAPLITESSSPTSPPPPAQWVTEKQALEREKLHAEVEILRLQKVKLRLEIEALLQQRQPDSIQVLEDCLK